MPGGHDAGSRYLVTGGAGFIGSNLVRFLLDTDPDVSVTNLDALSYAGVRATVDELDRSERHRFVHGDVRDRSLLSQVVPGHDVIVHCAAESHVDRSISGPTVFADVNVVGTAALLEAAMDAGVERFVQVSTDEVYGSIDLGSAAEDAPLRPSSPYSASKAGADLLALAYARTFGYRPIITRCTNNYGPYQYPEKVIPLFITNLLEGRKLPLYGDGEHERDWLFVKDHCEAIKLVIDRGSPGEVYNIAADEPLTNNELSRALLAALDRDESWIEPVADRPGHDRRYALDSAKVRALGWSPRHSFMEGVAATVEWYREREDWWRPLKVVA